MAYTYDDFVSTATSAGMLDTFTQEDLDIAKVNPEFGLSMVKLRQDAGNATTTEQKLLAEEAQNQLRKVYTAKSSTTDDAGSTGSFVFSKEQQLQDLTDKVVNKDPFQYDRSQDDSYSNLRKQYLREAERSREDTLARASAGTGGAPSSFAVTAAQQAGDYHLTQLADREVDLEQNAYQRYLNDYQKQISDLGVLTDQKEFDYAAYLAQKEQEQKNLQNAMALYQTYGNTMTVDQLKKMFTDMGLMSPGINTFLDNIQAAKSVASSGYVFRNPPDDDPEEPAVIDDPLVSEALKALTALTALKKETGGGAIVANRGVGSRINAIYKD